MNLAQPLPHSLEAERALLGAVLLDNAKLEDVRGLRSQDFFLEQHRRVHRCMIALGVRQRAIDLVTLAEELERSGEFEAAGGAAYLAQLVDGVPRVTNVDHYAQIVKEKALLRRLAYTGNRITEAALAGDVESALLHARTAATENTHGENSRAIALPTAEEFLTGGEAGAGDFLISGILPVHGYVIWQGRPKVGKSHTLLQLNFDLACGLPVFGYFPVPRPVPTVYSEMEEPASITRARFAAMLRAQDGNGPENMRFITRDDLHRWRMLPRELLGAALRDFIKVLRDSGAELVTLIALRRFIAPGENLKDPEVAERVNEALEMIRLETGAAICLAHHDRKSPGETVEMLGFGSTFISAAADAVFDLERAGDGGIRKVRAEGRYGPPERFWLSKMRVGGGEAIRYSEPPVDENLGKVEALRRRVSSGESIRQAAKETGVAFETARRWLKDPDPPTHSLHSGSVGQAE